MASIERDRPVEHCGVAGGIDFDGKSISHRLVVMMNAVNHRGQDSAGLATFDGEEFRMYKQLGLVSRVFSKKVLERRGLNGFLAIGHNRYKIQGGDTLRFTQPILATQGERTLALAHNGNVPNLDVIKENLSRFGVSQRYRFDSDGLAKSIVAAPGNTWIERIQSGLEGVVGSYSLVMGTGEGSLLVVRDPWGNRPLVWANIEGGLVFASETVAFNQLRINDWHEVKPGQIIEVKRDGQMTEGMLLQTAGESKCMFEEIYLKYPTSAVNKGLTVAKFRSGLGKKLAGKYPNLGEVVTAVPESAKSAAHSFAHHTGLPEEDLILKKPDQIKRAFMSGEMQFRKRESDAKFNFSPDAYGKKVIAVDDSIVGGTTGEIMTANFRMQAEPESVVLLSSAPKIIRDCPWGVNMRSRDVDFAAYDSVEGRVRDDEEIAKRIGVDKVGYLTVEEMLSVVNENGLNPDSYCIHCFGGRGLAALKYRNTSRPEMVEAGELITIG